MGNTLLRKRKSPKGASYARTGKHYDRIDDIIAGLAVGVPGEKRLETLWLIACLYQSAKELKTAIVDSANEDKRLFGDAYHRNYRTLMVVARVDDDDFDVRGAKVMRQ